MFFSPQGIHFPAPLADRLQKALFGGAPSTEQLRARGRGLMNLWAKLAKRRGQVSAGERHYSFLKEEAEAYAAYYLPANALKVALVMEEALLAGADLSENSIEWLDCGTGPGTAYWGLAWWCQERQRRLKFTGWDQSPVFAAIASRLAGRAEGVSFLADAKETPLSLTQRLAPTHLSFVNSVAEIYPDPARRQTEIARLLGVLAAQESRDGRRRYLILIEPGSQESSRDLATLKDHFSAQVCLPCLDDRPCGALANPRDWCHEEVACDFPPWLNELGDAANLRKEALLFSYVVLAAVPTKSALAGAARVVSQRLERKGQVECWACTMEGKRSARAQRSKTGAEAAPVKEANRGDIWLDWRLGAKGDFEAGRRLAPLAQTIFSSIGNEP